VTAEAEHLADGGGGEVCWCCGAVEPSELMVHLHDRPEVALCRGCARWVARRAREIDDQVNPDALVQVRRLVRRVRKAVIARGWHEHPLFGRPLRWIDKRLR
jgi:hypothetical protein